MNYKETIQWLESMNTFGIKPGLSRISAIMEKLGHPEKTYSTIHVTGTNGKGSVVAMMTSVLENANLTIGRFTSPHLLEYTERIHVNGKDITQEDFAASATAIKTLLTSLLRRGKKIPRNLKF